VIIRRHRTTWELCWRDERAEFEKAYEFPDQRSALVFLLSFKSDRQFMARLRDLLAQRSLGQNVSRLSDQRVLEEIAWRLGSRQLQLRYRHDVPRTSVASSGGPSATSQSQAPPAPEPKTPKTWVEFRLIDMEGNPVGNMHYTVVLPSGAAEDGYLDSSGSVRFNGIDPGDCTITFPDLDRDAWDWA
jgi:hypothetical protein